MRRVYRSVVPRDLLVRIKDLDGDIVIDVNVCGEVGLYLWHYPDLYEREQRERFCATITPGCRVLDVGANIGLYTLLAAKRGAYVYSVEADPANAAMLRHHVAINGFTDRVAIFEVAATDREGDVTLFRHPYNPGQSNIIERGQPSGLVKGTSLDSLGLPPIDICKMDIEGAELGALKGMASVMAHSPRFTLFVEYAQELGHGEALLAYLRANFSSITVLEQTDALTPDEIPPFCNLLAVR